MSIARGFLLIYIIVIIFGVWWLLKPQSPDIELKSTADFSAGHPVKLGDLSFNPTHPTYLARSIDEGEIVGLEVLVETYERSAKPGSVPIAVPVAQNTISTGIVVAGKQLRLCPSNVEGWTRTVHCTAEGDNCIAIIDVPPKGKAALIDIKPTASSAGTACKGD